MSFFLGHVGMNTKDLLHEGDKEVVAFDDLAAIFIASGGESRVAIIRLIKKVLLFKKREGFVHRRLRDPHLLGDIDRANGLLGTAAQLNNRFKVVFMRFGNLHLQAPLFESYGHNMQNPRPSVGTIGDSDFKGPARGRRGGVDPLAGSFAVNDQTREESSPPDWLFKIEGTQTRTTSRSNRIF